MGVVEPDEIPEQVGPLVCCAERRAGEGGGRGWWRVEGVAVVVLGEGGRGGEEKEEGGKEEREGEHDEGLSLVGFRREVVVEGEGRCSVGLEDRLEKRLGYVRSVEVAFLFSNVVVGKEGGKDEEGRMSPLHDRPADISGSDRAWALEREDFLSTPSRKYPSCLS